MSIQLAYEIRCLQDMIESLMRQMNGLAPHPGQAAALASLSVAFNARSLYAALMEAFLRDLPSRRRLERLLAHYHQKLQELLAQQPAPALAA